MFTKKIRHNLYPLSVVLLFVLLSSLYSIAVPIWEAPDEPSHYLRIRRLAEPGFFVPDFPGPSRTVWSEHYLYSFYQNSQPPFYYLLAAAGLQGLNLFLPSPCEQQIFLPVQPDRRQGGNVFLHPPAGLSKRFSGTASVYCLRWLSVLLGALTVFLVYRIGRVLCPSEPAVALGAGGFAATLPQFNFISGAIGNDPAAALLGSAALLFLVARVRKGRSVGACDYLGLGVLLTLGLLTKFNLVFLLPTALIFIVFKAREPVRRIKWWLALILTVAPPAIMVAVALLVSPGEVLLKSRILSFRLLRVTGEMVTGDQIRHMIWTVSRSFFALFGWMSVPVSGWLYLAWGLLGGAALIGWWRRPVGTEKRLPGSLARPAGLLLAAVVILFLGVIKNNLLVPQSQGRFLFPALGAIAPLLAVGFCRLFPSRYRTRAAWFLIVVLASLNLLAFARLIGQIY